MQSLAREWDPNALYQLDWLHKFGDDGLEADPIKLRAYRVAAALLGNEDAVKYWAEMTEAEWGAMACRPCSN